MCQLKQILLTIPCQIRSRGSQNKIAVPLFLFVYMLYILIIFSIDFYHFVRCYFPVLPVFTFAIMVLFSLALIYILLYLVDVERGWFDIADLLVVFILMLLFFMRMLYPIQTLIWRNYHIYFQNFCFQDNFNYHFFPASIYSFFFPLSDRLFSFFRKILGFRMGTVLNCLIIIVIYKQIKDILQRYIRTTNFKINNSMVSLFSLMAVSTEFILFNFATYLVDLLFIPLLIEVLRLILFRKDGSPKWFYYCAVLLGFTLALKFTAIIFIIIFIGLFVLNNRNNLKLSVLFTSALLFILPLSIYIIYNYSNTGHTHLSFL